MQEYFQARGVLPVISFCSLSRLANFWERRFITISCFFVIAISSFCCISAMLLSSASTESNPSIFSKVPTFSAIFLGWLFDSQKWLRAQQVPIILWWPDPTRRVYWSMMNSSDSSKTMCETICIKLFRGGCFFYSVPVKKLLFRKQISRAGSTCNVKIHIRRLQLLYVATNIHFNSIHNNVVVVQLCLTTTESANLHH